MVDVVIVTYNASAVLSACLEALQDRPGVVNPIVVDNDSADDTVAIATEAGADIIGMGSNAGFGAACNAGVARGVADVVLFLNPDAVVSGADVLKAAEALRDLEAGVLGCRLVQADGTFDHAAKRMIISPLEGAKFLFKRHQDSRYLAPQVGEGEAGEVDAVNGAFLMIPRALFTEVGGFDERFWMYAEDLDLCWRVKQSGRQVIYWPEVTALHLKSALSGKSRSPRLNYHFHKSMWIFYRKHQAARDGLAERAFVFAGIVGRGGWVTARDAYRRRRGIGRPISELTESTQ